MIEPKELEQFIEDGINEYHEKILDRLQKLKLPTVLKRKNPYLFKVKSINTSQELIESILSAHLSSQEEAIFGGVLEELAIHINKIVFQGIKSSAEGIDLEFEKDSIRYIVSIKSGPNWGNSSQIAKMKDNFKKAKRIIGTNSKKQNVVAINGCCYGKEGQTDKGEYLKLCGQDFWEIISGNPQLYTDIIEPIGRDSLTRNEKFNKEYGKVVNKFTLEFSRTYCKPSGEIDWNLLLKYNSGNSTT